MRDEPSCECSGGSGCQADLEKESAGTLECWVGDGVKREWQAEEEGNYGAPDGVSCCIGLCISRTHEIIRAGMMHSDKGVLILVWIGRDEAGPRGVERDWAGVAILLTPWL